MDDGISVSAVMMVDSISFGRYESDSSLAWEKFSAFSHNRYMEEVQKFAVPGSVAKKRAYFEAYYKRKRAQIAADLLDLTQNHGTILNATDCDGERRIKINTEGTGTANVDNSEGTETPLNEGRTFLRLSRSDSCYEQADSSNEPRSSSAAMLDGKPFDGEEMNPCPSGDSHYSGEIFEDQNQMPCLKLQESCDDGNEPRKESFDINREAPTVDRTKKKSVVSPKRSCSDGVDPPPIASLINHLSSPNKAPNTDDATSNRKKRPSCMPRFRNRSKTSSEGLESCMPPTERRGTQSSVTKELICTSTSCTKSISSQRRSAVKYSCFSGINRLFASSFRQRNGDRPSKGKEIIPEVNKMQHKWENKISLISAI